MNLRFKHLILHWTLVFLSLFCLAAGAYADRSNDALKNGPMLSDLTFREAQIWIQTHVPSEVRIRYFESSTPETVFHTEYIQTKVDKACVANFVLHHIGPNKNYSYAIEVGGTISKPYYSFESLNYFHGKEPPPDISIALIGSHYAIEDAFEPPYIKRGGGYGIFDKIYRAQPDLVLWTGNTAHLRKSDFDSKQAYYKRYTQARSLIQPKALLAEIPQLGIWSSKDYGPPGYGRTLGMKSAAQRSFMDFWPKSASVEYQSNLYYSHKLSDVEFFFLDVQSERDSYPRSSRPLRILGEAQIEWLKDALLNSEATFKIIVSGAPVLNPSKSPQNLSYAESEKQELLDFLKSYNISGLFFISGGSYKGELTRLVHSSYYSFFDWTIGPSTATPLREDNELNFFRIPGTNTFEQQYGILSIKGEEGARRLEMTAYSLAGIQLWSRTIEANELSAFE